MLETWNWITDDNIAIYANEIWGTRDWTLPQQQTKVFQIAEMNQTCGKLGNANIVTLIGGKKFLE
jgi:hypothetical protein